MRQQEEKLRAKYGDLKPKKKLIHKVRAFGGPAETKKKCPEPTLATPSTRVDEMMLLLRHESVARLSPRDRSR